MSGLVDARGNATSTGSRGRARGERHRALADAVVLRHAARRPRRGDRRRPGVAPAAGDEGRLPAQPHRAFARRRGEGRCSTPPSRSPPGRTSASAATSPRCAGSSAATGRAPPKPGARCCGADPRDILALQWALLFDFYRGDAEALRERVAAVLPAWSEADPLHPYVLGHHAFGLEESGRYAEAEAVGRQALAGAARVPWAIHAVAHVMEMQGRHAEGAVWMATWRPFWGVGNGFAGHLGWHEALFALEARDHAKALEVFDLYLHAEANEITLQRVDAASLLWRLQLHGRRGRRPLAAPARRLGARRPGRGRRLGLQRRACPARPARRRRARRGGALDEPRRSPTPPAAARGTARCRGSWPRR